MSRVRILFALVLAVALAAGATVAFAAAAEPDSGAVSPTSRTVTWDGTVFTASAFVPEIEGPGTCAPPDTDDRCDHFALTVEPDAAGSDVEVQIAWPSPADDFDLYVFDGDTEVASSGQSATTSEKLTIPDASGVYEVRVVPFAVTDSGYAGGATSAQVVAAPPVAVGSLAAFLKGMPADEANSAPGGTASTSTFGPQAPDDPVPVMQNLTQFTNRNFAENFLGAFWTGPFTGTLDEALELTWFFSSADGAALTQVPAEVTVFADPPNGGGVVPPERIIGRQAILLNVGPTPTQNVSIVPVDGTVAERFTIQVALTGVAPNDVRVLYDNASTPSRFRQVAAPPPASQVTPPGVDGLPAADPQGLEFSATVPTDHQRDESEPLVEIDPQGNAYGCGPSGAGTFDFSQVSTDGGDQFHILGAQPTGAQTGLGGGDCQIALDPTVNDNGAHDYAYVGLGPLTSFAVAASDDTGRTLDPNVVNGATIPGVDRQWGAYVREDEVLLSYNQLVPRQIVVQRSIDSGRTYLPAVPASSLIPSFPGPMRSLPAEFNPVQSANTPRVAYFGWNNGSQINLSMSTDGGVTWSMCKVAESLGDPTLFVTVDHDDAGTIYVVYGEEASFHTYMTSLPVTALAGCNQPVARTTTAAPSVNPGFSTPVQVDRGGIRTSLFPWVTAGGAPGRVAVAFYGTESDGNPNSGEFKATWDVYVNQSLNATDPNATFSQVKATTHPFHYDSICLEGLGCSVSGGDRSLADFFAIDTNPANGELLAVYDQGSKRPDEAAGSSVATPAAVRQVAGPSLLGDSMTVDRPDRRALRTTSADPTGDAESSYSALVVNPGPQNQPAADFTGVSVGPEVDLATGAPVESGGFTVTMELADLSRAALQREMAATQSQSLLWVWRYVDGYRESSVSARWNPSQGFTFGHNGYRLNPQPNTCLTANKCIQYPGDTPVAGAVDQAAGTIRLSVPRRLITALDGPTGDRQRPAEVPATLGSRIYDGVALSLGNVESATQERQGLFYTLDGTPAFDFLIADPAATVSIGDVAVPEGDQGAAPAAFSVTLSRPVAETVTVDYATADGTATVADTDYTPETGTVTFPPESISATIEVDVVGDTMVELDETFTVTLSDPTGPAALERETGTATILNDDTAGQPNPATVSIGDASAAEGGNLVFSVRLSAAQMTDTTVEVRTSDGTAVAPGDYRTFDEAITIPAGQTSRNVTVASIQDQLAESDETFAVTLTDPSSGVAVTGDPGTGTILDDDEPGEEPTEEATEPSETPSSGSSPPPPPTPTPGPPLLPGPDDEIERIVGGGRLETSVLVSGQAFPDGAPAAVLARADDFPDALAAATLAAEVGGPVLLTGSDRLADEVAAELRRLGVETVYLVGGPVALTPPVQEAVDALGVESIRLAGIDRFVTADLIGREVVRLGGAVDAVIVARADDFPDALSAANLATYGRAPILLTSTSELSPQTERALDALLPGGAETVYLAGGTVATDATVEQGLVALGYDVERLAGATRFDTAAAILAEARTFDLDLEPALVANGFRFPDALAAGPAAHALGGGLLLVDPEDATRSPATLALLAADREAVDTVLVVGGEQAITALVDGQLADAIADD